MGSDQHFRRHHVRLDRLLPGNVDLTPFLTPLLARAVQLFILAVVAARVFAQAPDAQPEPSSGYNAKQAVHAKRFMVVAAHPLAAKAGYDVLKAGGNAVDAAIASQLVLALVEPQSSGLGGGGFALVYAASGQRLFAWDGRETAPAAATPDRFLTRGGRPLRHRE